MKRVKAAVVLGATIGLCLIGPAAQATPTDALGGRPSGSILSAGSSSGQGLPGGDFVDVAGTLGDTIGLRSDGTVVGSSSYSGVGRIPTPAPTDVVAIAARDVAAAALHQDGTVTTWDYNRQIPNDLGTGNVAISSGPFFVLSLTAAGTVRASGTIFAGDNRIPPGLKQVVAVSAGGFRGVSGTPCPFGTALKSDGTVVAWGGVQAPPGCYDRFVTPGRPPADLPDLVAISAGRSFVAGLNAQGQVFAWNNGRHITGLSEGVRDHVVSVDANTGLALKSDGSVVSMWSDNCDHRYGCPPETPPFAGSVVSRLAGDGSTNVAIAAPTAIGSPVLQLRPDSNQPGQAEAFSFVADQAGSTDRLRIYLDASSKASTVKVGIYGGTPEQPGKLLGSGTISDPTAGRWHQARLSSPVDLCAGSTYWIAVLGPDRSGRVAFRDREHDGSSTSVTSKEVNLNELPSRWRIGSSFDDSPISAYGVPVGAS